MDVFLTGNVGYLNDRFLQDVFPEDHILIDGECEVTQSRSVLILQETDNDGFGKMLEDYELDRVVYFSQYLTLHGERDAKMEKLRKVLQYCRNRDTQMLVLTGPHGSYSEETGKTVLASAAEQLCLHYAEKNGVHLKIVRLPYLYSASIRDGYFYRLFEKMEKDLHYEFPEAEDQSAYFLSMDDLSDLVFRIFDSWDGTTEIFNVPDVFGNTFGQLGEALKVCVPEARLSFSQFGTNEVLPENDRVLRNRYGWYPKVNILTEILELYGIYRETSGNKLTRFERFKLWRNGHMKLWQSLEAVIVFALAQALVMVLEGRPQFQFMDIRLLYVVLIGTMFGINLGVLAAALASASLAVSYLRSGVNWETLFYVPSNWLPFIFYFTVGAICGYIRMKNRNTIQFLGKEYDLLKEKFLFMNELYRDTFQEKRDLKRQILASKDSFGKIFDITKKLDDVRPQEIFRRAIHVMEDVLENHSIMIYSFGKNPYFARLEAASRQVIESAPRSLRVDDYRDAVEAVEKDGIWTNKALTADRPAYMAGIKKDGKLVLLILLKTVDHAQMTLYYENLLKILCGLVETSLLRALNYNEAVHSEQYLEGSVFMKESFFRERLALYQAMKDEKLLEYTMLELDPGNMSPEEVEHILSSVTRENDTVGIMEEVELYLLLHQTAPEQARIVMERLEKSGFASRVVANPEVFLA